jgi:2-polyprenyl-6-methoxyphenol hydroxylase-like FAD-dependent oxidoreductase
MRIALIVGAGIGGLAAGLALRRAGWDIRIFERAEAPRELGFGLGLAPNAIAALGELGVADAILPHTVTPAVAEIRHADGRVIRRFARSKHDPSPIDLPRIILRPALHGALLDAVGTAAIESNSEAIAFELDGRRAHLRLATGSVIPGDMIVGADGVQSNIRARLHRDEPPPRPSGYFALRGASNAVASLDGLNAIWYFGRGVESGIVQASENTIYWFLSVFADDVRAGSMDATGVLRRWAPQFDAQFQAITGASAPAQMRLDELFERDPRREWGSGPVTLLGDAAHPMLPHTGQGAAQALEDAAGLGRAMRSISDPIAALRRYEDVRSRRTRLIVRSGPRIAHVTTTRNPLIAAVRNALIRFIPEIALVKVFTGSGRDPNQQLGSWP